MMHVPDSFSETQAYFDLAFDYANAGLWEEASDVLSRQLGDTADSRESNASVCPGILCAPDGRG